jgi:hypothetical protein
VPDSSPTKIRIALSYLIVVAAAALGWLIYTKTDPQQLVVDASGFSVFAPLYIVAQAIERFLEPLASRWNSTTDKKLELKSARSHRARLEALPAGDPNAGLANLEAADQAIVAAELALAKAKAQRAIPLWAAASALGLVVCSLLGLGLIEATATTRPESEYIRTLDVLLTGLAVGAGTKPLHDLISRIEKAKDSADPATKPAGHKA